MTLKSTVDGRVETPVAYFLVSERWGVLSVQDVN